MDYKSLPADLVNKLKPADMQMYAEATGWKRLEAFGEEIAVYRQLDSKSNEIIVPLDTEFADYSQRMADAIIGLAEFENRSPKEVLDELLLPADTVCFRLEDSVIQNGAVPLESALNLINGGQRALFAVVSNDYTRSPESSDDRVKQMMFLSHYYYNQIANTCRFEVDRESFSTYFIYPLDYPHDSIFTRLHNEISYLLARMRHKEEFGLPIPSRPNILGRFIIETLMRSTKSIVQAVTEDDLDSLLNLQEEVVEMEDAGESEESSESNLIISSELCDALLDMQPRSEGGNLILKATFAKIAPSSYESLGEIRIPQPLFSKIEGLARELRQKDELKSSFYVGKINQIGDSHNGEIFLTLLDNSGSGLFKARVELNPIDFEKACHAHREGYNVGILGELQKDRPINHIRDYKLFQVLVPITMGESSFSFIR